MDRQCATEKREERKPLKSAQFGYQRLEHSNSRFESIRFDSLCEYIRIDSFCKKIGLSIH